MDVEKLADHSWLGLDEDSILLARKMLAECVQWRTARQTLDEAEFREAFDKELSITNKARLFGTSGIRGNFNPDITTHAVAAFVNSSQLSSKLVYFAGIALGRLSSELHIKGPAWIFMDPRLSSMGLAQVTAQGLVDAGASVAFGGVATTPCYCLLPSHLCIVITASHNPAEYNGIKVFWQGRPIVKKHEIQIETTIRVLSDFFETGKMLSVNEVPGAVIPCAPELEKKHFSFLHNLPSTAQLRISTKLRMENRFLPLDLAYGAAACPLDENGEISRFSPPLTLFLSLGLPVIGYGCFRRPRRINHRVGAAYAYGETPYIPRQDELSKFARGQPGYGGRAPRIAFLPEQFVSSNPGLSAIISRKNSLRKILIGFPDYQSAAYAIPLDKKNGYAPLITEIETMIMNRDPLPGLIVDGDADRLLITTPDLSKKEIPYLTGDGLIRFFAETAPADYYDEIVFTVESGIALEKALLQYQQQSRKSGKTAFDIRVVTVGDRAIIDYFMERGKGNLLGGEPSGHIIFGEPFQNEVRIIDDPFVTYLRLIDRLASERYHLDAVWGRMFWNIPEVYCSRKPDSRAGSGISLTEKMQIELWDHQDPQRISRYAGLFLPAYIEMFAKAYASAFLDDDSFQTAFTWEWERLLENSLQSSDWNEDLKIAVISFGAGEVIEELQVGLHLDRREWAGPDAIRIAFFLEVEKNQVKMGEGVFRNSGTSPKNSGYHKLWPIHPVRGTALSEGKLRTVLDSLATSRAQWTDNYITQKIRLSDSN